MIRFLLFLIYVLTLVSVAQAQKIADFEFDDISNMPHSLLTNSAGPDAIFINPSVKSDGEGLYCTTGDDFDLRIPKTIYEGAESITMEFDFYNQENYSGLVYGGYNRLHLGHVTNNGFRIVYYTEADPSTPISSGFHAPMKMGERAIITFIYDKQTGVAQLMKNQKIIWSTPSQDQTPGAAFLWNMTNDYLTVGYNLGETGSSHPSLYYFKMYTNSCTYQIEKPVVNSMAERCGPGDLTFKASGGDNGNYRWYNSSTTEDYINNEYDSTYTSNLLSSDTVYVSLLQGICESERVPVKGEIHKLPEQPTVMNGESCGKGKVELKANGATDGNYRWYHYEDQQNPIAGAVNSSFTTPVLGKTTGYYVTNVNANCESKSVLVNAIINDLPAPPIIHDTLACGKGELEITVESYSELYYYWYSSEDELITDNSSGKLLVKVNSDTMVYVASYDNNCESHKVPVKIDLIIPGEINAGNDKQLVFDKEVQLNASGNFLKFNWSPAESLDNPFIPNPIASPSVTTTYTVTGTDQHGCMVSDELTVNVLKEFPVPNAFSPNRDGVNETWEIPLIDKYPESELFIFNRWGNLVYYNKGSYVPWDGTSTTNNVVQSGTYIYKLNLGNGKTIKGSLVVIK